MSSPPRLRRILLTGASGLIGGELAGRLAGRGHRVTGLGNRVREVRRNDGAALPVTHWPEHRTESVALIGGDVTRPMFGLDDATARAVSADHDLLIHCAAATAFGADEAVHRAVNIDGTRRAAELAELGAMAMLHVSTAYVCGAQSGPVAESEPVGPVRNGYEASKREAEAVVRRSGVRAAIARPSIVVGDWTSGAIRDFDTFHLLFRLLALGRIRAVPALADATLDFVPIDHVAGGLVDLAERIGEAAGGTFHLVSGAPVPVTSFRDAIAAWPGFRAPELVEPERFDPAALPASERRLHARAFAPYADYFRHDPRFLDDRARTFTGRTCPPTDAAFLHRLIAHAVAAGFVEHA